jgi:hypothetical protein
MGSLAERALAACIRYETLSAAITEATHEIRRTVCPYESESEFETHSGPTLSCYRAACEVRTRGGGRLNLSEVAREVAGCAHCSQLVELVRARRHARRMLGAVKRQLCRIGKRALELPSARGEVADA